MMVHKKCISNKTMSTEDQGMQEKGPKSQITKASLANYLVNYNLLLMASKADLLLDCAEHLSSNAKP